MTLLVISPDFISHYSPLAVIAGAAKLAGQRVIIATGMNMAPHVHAAGFEWVLLQLSRQSNDGIVSKDVAIRHFINATHGGPITTLRRQALDREKDLLWQPVEVARQIVQLCDQTAPDNILLDHVSFGSTLGVYATGRPFITLVPGHPSQLPVGNERYGIPSIWPSCMLPDPVALAGLEDITDRVTTAFTDRWNTALFSIAPNMRPVRDAFRVHGEQVLYNSLEQYHVIERSRHLPMHHQFIGPLIRSEPLTHSYRRWLDQTDSRPIVYVALGTFLSHRVDVLNNISLALQQVGARVAMAIGSTPMSIFEPLPRGWLLAPRLPQVALLHGCDIIIHHGGNNSVQEALGMGVRQIVLPFSTDQFANAADLERAGQATVVPPNHISPPVLAQIIREVMTLPRPQSITPLSSTALASKIIDPHCNGN